MSLNIASPLLAKQFEELAGVRGREKGDLLTEIAAPYLVEREGQECILSGYAKDLIRIAFEKGYQLGHAEASTLAKEAYLAEITGIS